MRTRVPLAMALTILPVFAASNSGLIQVTGIRSWSHPDSTRIILELNGPFDYRSERAVNPDRLFFDLQHARPLIAGRRYATHQVNDAVVRRVRIAETVPGTTRVVFDLTGPADFKVSRLDTPDRMVIEIRKVGHSTTGPAFIYPPVTRIPRRNVILAVTPPLVDPNPLMGNNPLTEPLGRLVIAKLPRPIANPTLTAVSPNQPPLPAIVSSTRVLAAPKPASYDAVPHASDNATRSLTRALGLKVNRIVIDAGHGGHDDGTIGPNGVLEKDVVLDVALRLSKLIQTRMGAEVVLTRSEDNFIPLHERTQIANEQKADLFLSIHANSSPAPTVAGTETFFLNFTTSPTNLDVASRENAGADKSVGELKDLIQSITLNDKIAESETFAQAVEAAIYGQAAKSNVAAKNRGVKRAPFVVLIGASMPSILAEIGFLSNPRDESNLSKPDYRQKIAEALFKGVSQYAQSLSHFEVSGDSAKPKTRAGLN